MQFNNNNKNNKIFLQIAKIDKIDLYMIHIKI